MTSVPLGDRIALPIRSTLAARPLVAGFALTVSAGILVLAGLSAGLGLATADAILPGVSIGGVNVGGMSRAEAESRLAESLPSLSDGAAVVVAADQRFTVPYERVGRAYDLDAMLDAAAAVGRDAGPIGDGIARLRALLHHTGLAPIARPLDPDALESVASDIAAAVTLTALDARVSLDGMTATVHQSRPGLALSATVVADALRGALAGTDPDGVSVAVEPSVVQPRITTAMAASAAGDAERMMHGLRLGLSGGRPSEDLVLSGAQISSLIIFGPADGKPYAATIDRLALVRFMLGARDRIDRDPVDARFTVSGTTLDGVEAGKDGRTLQLGAAVHVVERALAERATGASVYRVGLPVVLSEPALTTAAAEAALPDMQLVSAWTTHYVPNDGNGYGANISIGAWDLDGYTIAPGEWFSFWDGIGPVTTARGYKYGGAIINGRSVANGALAGGICSTSTTLFNAAMRFGLEIGERENHYYYIDRYPTGLDATVAIVDDDVTDMTFRNDTEHPIVIRGYATPGQVTFQLWSVPNGRRVVLSAPVISNRRSAIETTQLVSSMAPGTARRVEFPHNGFDVTVTRTVYDADGNVVHQNTWFSDYRPVNGITMVGPPLPAPPPASPAPPTPAP